MKIQIGDRGVFAGNIARKPGEIVDVSPTEANLLIGMRKAKLYIPPETEEAANAPKTRRKKED